MSNINRTKFSLFDYEFPANIRINSGTLTRSNHQITLIWFHM